MSGESGTRGPAEHPVTRPARRRRVVWLIALALLVAGAVVSMVLIIQSHRKVTVPAALVPLISSAAKTCPAITPSLLAAQLYAESRFRAEAVSPAGAQGIAQFTRETWAEWGVDGNGDGVRNVFDPADAVAGQAKYDCWLAEQVAAVPGDATENMLAAYNAGPGKVTQYGGVPPYSETKAYVSKVQKYAGLFGYLDQSST